MSEIIYRTEVQEMLEKLFDDLDDILGILCAEEIEELKEETIDQLNALSISLAG